MGGGGELANLIDYEHWKLEIEKVSSYTFRYIYIHFYTSIYIYIYLYTFVYNFIHLYTFLCIYIHLHTFVYIYINSYTFIYIHIHIYIYIYIKNIFIHLYTSLHEQPERLLKTSWMSTGPSPAFRMWLQVCIWFQMCILTI